MVDVPDTYLRGLLALDALVALLFAGAWFGTIWHDRTWPIRVVCIGFGGVLAYVLAGQAKAYNLGIPFDAYSWLGLIAYTVLLAGFTWHRSRERRSRRGR